MTSNNPNYLTIIFTGAVLLLALNGCAQEKADKELLNMEKADSKPVNIEQGGKKQVDMEKEIVVFQDQLYNKIKKYSKRPLYIVQVNKKNCRALVLCNDIPHWLTLYENTDESMALYLNNYIPKTGPQVLSVKVYPREGEDFITEMAAVDLKICFAADKDHGVDQYKTITKAELPADIGTKKLKYYEFEVPFEATVPFNFSAELANAQNLKSVPGIETKVVEKYKQLQGYLVKGDGLSFARAFEKSDLKSSTYLYATKQELIADDQAENVDVQRARLDLKNRKVKPIEQYELVFFAGGKLAKLQTSKDKKEMLTVDFEDGNGQSGFEKPVLLYLPAGSKELEIW